MKKTFNFVPIFSGKKFDFIFKKQFQEKKFSFT